MRREFVSALCRCFKSILEKMVTCIAVGGLCQSRQNLEGKMSIPGEVSLCRYPTPAGAETDSWFGAHRAST